MLFDCPSKQEKGPELCSSSRGKWGCPGVLGWMERALHPKPGLCGLILRSVGEKSIYPCAASSGRAVPVLFPMPQA